MYLLFDDFIQYEFKLRLTSQAHLFVEFSIRTLQRVMKAHDLKRYDHTVTPQQIAEAVQVCGW